MHGTLILLGARLFALGLDGKPPPAIQVDVVESSAPEPEVLAPAASEAPAPPLPAPSRPRPRERPVPLPNREQTPSREPPRPVFGVAAESLLDGESPVAVPVGNTTMTADRATGPVHPYAAEPTKGTFSPEAAKRIVTQAEFDVDDAAYPAQAEREAIEGNVVLEVDVDREGHVRAVKVLTRAGYGMDENAVRAILKTHVKPCRSQDGPVDCRVKHTVHFQPARSEPEAP